MSSPSPTLLVVDDDVDTCHNLKDILSDLGYEVDIAHDGLSALERVQQRAYDIALLDLRMPGMDGLTLYREMRKHRSCTVAIVVTAYPGATTLTEAKAAGVSEVLTKPVDFGKLLPLVERSLGQPLVLVVDDDPDLCANLWDLLRERDYRVCLAHNKQEAEDRLKEKDYHVVLIDMRLPQGNGADVHHLVKESNPQARTVLITGYRSETEKLVQQVLIEGADAVCYKPFDVPDLLALLQRLSPPATCTNCLNQCP